MNSMLTDSKRRQAGARVLFVVRGKLGDTLAAMACIVDYAQRHADETVYVLVRRAYVNLFEGTPRLRLLPFGSSGELLWHTLRLRLAGKLDKLAVVWGFGNKMPWLARLSGAPLRAYFDHRFPAGVFTHIAPPEPNSLISDAAWRVASQLDPALPRPRRLVFESLQRMRMPGEYVALVPVADELRKCLDREHFDLLVKAARARFPGSRLIMLGNLRDAPLHRIIETPLPADVEFVPFADIPTLTALIARCRYLLTVDTGVYHLACAMGVPASVFFGPTEPDKIVLPEQTDIEPVRLAALGGRVHCEVKHCVTPVCLYEGLREWTAEAQLARPQLPAGCLLLAPHPARQEQKQAPMPVDGG